MLPSVLQRAEKTWNAGNTLTSHLLYLSNHVVASVSTHNLRLSCSVGPVNNDTGSIFFVLCPHGGPYSDLIERQHGVW